MTGWDSFVAGWCGALEKQTRILAEVTGKSKAGFVLAGPGEHFLLAPLGGFC
jgi:hypothetical protein